MFPVYQLLVARQLEIEERRRQARRMISRQLLRSQVDPFYLSENSFIKNFRLSKEAALYIIDLIGPSLEAAGGPRSSFIPVPIKVLCALAFFGSGSYQTLVGNSMLSNMCQSSVSRCIKAVSTALVRLKLIKFPRNDLERERKKNRFLAAGLPDVIGCVDGTHIAITTPSDREDVYVNRRGYHSVNVQLVCDYDLEIINVVASYPGSTHDSFIWRNSRVEAIMRGNHFSGDIESKIIGDSGYPCLPWLLTPYTNPPPHSLQSLYNDRHAQVRSCVERCIGVLKGRFRCLLRDRTLHYQPQNACRIIIACAFLHNVARQFQLEDPNLEYDAIDMDPPAPAPLPTHDANLRFEGQRVRDVYTLNFL